MIDHLDRLENESIHVLREAYATIKPLAMLWSLGKDSSVMIWLAKKAFFGHFPFPVVHLDTGAGFPEVYAFRETYTRLWNLTLIADACPPIEAVDPTLPPASRFAARKTGGLKEVLRTYGFAGLIAGIRRDERSTRAKERVFSVRDGEGTWDVRDQRPEFWNQYNTVSRPGGHIRIHPLLPWTEVDIWKYIARENIPVVPLYFARDGMRFRSLGEIGITFPVESEAASIAEIIAELEETRTEERSGRAMDHEAEDAFERLRVDGYL